MNLGGLFAIGTSHVVAPASLREALAMSKERTRRFLAEIDSVLPTVHEAAILSTCTRTEIYLVAPDRSAAERVRDRLASRAADQGMKPDRHIYLLEAEAAARHVFRVAAGLDSIVLGEDQILSQVKDARRLAWAEGTCGTVLCQLLDDAVRCGKRIRSETALNRGSVSIASAAVRFLEHELGGLQGRTVLVLGTGETGGLAARVLAKRGPESLVVVNRTRRAAEALACEVGERTESLRDLPDVLAHCDAAICATASAEPVLGPDLLRRVQRARSSRPLVLVDIATPRDVDAAAGEIPGIVLIDLDDMREQVEGTHAQRQEEVEPAERIVDEELSRFLEWLDSRDVVPLLRALRETFHEIGDEVLEAEVRRFGEEYREPLSRATHRLLNKLLHAPTVRLKSLDPSMNTDLLKLRAIEDLFALRADGESSEPAGGAAREAEDGDSSDESLSPRRMA